MKINARVLLLVGNAALGFLLLAAQPRNVDASWQKLGCCKHDTSGQGVCCRDCCEVINDACTSSSACPRLPET